MAKFVPAPEKIKQAHALIQKARDLPVPTEGGRWNYSYVAQVREYLQKARDLVKFIPRTPSATAELKEAVKKIFEEADLAHKEILS
ncbi:MAG TPA: hypothetical protein PK530_12955 [Anaerolineales bacterium]|nr:hypothetical protein [Anaerolineales bacterium]